MDSRRGGESMKKRVNGAWVADKYYQYQQNTATVENSKTIAIYSDGSNLTDYSFEGQCSQASTPTPSSPVEVECFGDLIASGDNAGKYDIPITSGGVTEHIILSEPLRKIGDYADSVNSEGVVTRRIKELVLDGTEKWVQTSSDGVTIYYFTGVSNHLLILEGFCTHMTYGIVKNANEYMINQFHNLFANNCGYSTLADFKTFLATQYTNGTPVIVYYVLATPTTESVTAPTIPTSSGFSNIEIGTSLAPSKFEYDLGKMFVAKGQGKVRHNGEWI
jgi:hypothetical protein